MKAAYPGISYRSAHNAAFTALVGSSSHSRNSQARSRWSEIVQYCN